MAEFMAQRIVDGAQNYSFVISKRPDLKGGIDAYLTEKERTDLIVS
ncbi:hypothetical protein J23TS9_06120 [Paenibacillus sp. J23TS9]|nr:hypothetical protein [Paenibacillus sp. J23TS9]GIP25482.1 hypothetical protein J23TS9_06120 [Paenibacillus sp. J23TS9]